MKVKEAIKLLQSMDQETDVYLDFGLYYPEEKYYWPVPYQTITTPRYYPNTIMCGDTSYKFMQ